MTKLTKKARQLASKKLDFALMSQSESGFSPFMERTPEGR
jgi:hypothetical protein